jgi:hypothetical protein
VLGEIGNRQVVEGEPLQFTVTATDSDSGSLTFSLGSGAPTGAALNPQTGVFSWTPTLAQAPGVYQVTIRATDDSGQSDTETISITVIDVNEAPSLAAIGAKSVAEGNLLSFTVTATDPNAPHETLRYSLDSLAPAGATINPNTGEFRWSPSETQGPGNYHITIRVTDARGLSDAKTVDIAVAEIDQSPVIAPIDDQFAVGGQQLEVQVSAIDPDAPAQPITYTLVSGPDGATIGATTGLFRWTPGENVAGRFNVVVRATEASGASSTVTFGITAGLDAFGIMLTSRLNMPQLINDVLPAQVQSFVPFDISANRVPTALQIISPDSQRFAAVAGLDRIQASGEVVDTSDEQEDNQVKPATGTEPVGSDSEVPSGSDSQPGDSSGEAILELLDAAMHDLFGAQDSEGSQDWIAEMAPSY